MHKLFASMHTKNVLAGKGTLLFATSWNVTSLVPDEVIGFVSLSGPSSRIMALWSTQPVTEKSTRNHPGSKGQPACKADLTRICELIVWKMWES
jgi:hypothetical protein